jgi:hypothetical protein
LDVLGGGAEALDQGGVALVDETKTLFELVVLETEAVELFLRETLVVEGFMGV